MPHWTETAERIAERLRSIQAGNDEAGSLYCQRLTAQAAELVAHNLPAGGPLPEFPRPLLHSGDMSHQAELQWSMKWAMFVHRLRWRFPGEIPFAGDARLYELTSNNGVSIEARSHHSEDWRQRAEDAADVLEWLAGRLRPDAGGSESGAAGAQHSKVTVPTNEDVARVVNLVAAGESVLAAARKVAENSVHSAGSLKTMYYTWRRQS